jgi:hypothetical protein
VAEPVLRPQPEAGEFPCANHPQRTTGVRCSDCGKAICPDCMVFSPVGVKCRECAKLPRSALLTLKPARGAKAVAASIGVGTLLGFGYYALLGGIGFFFFAFFIGMAIGALVGEAVLRASGYYHGMETALIAVAGTLWAFVFPPLLGNVMRFGLAWDTVLFSLTGRSIIGWLVMGIAGYVAWQRNR